MDALFEWVNWPTIVWPLTFLWAAAVGFTLVSGYFARKRFKETFGEEYRPWNYQASEAAPRAVVIARERLRKRAHEVDEAFFKQEEAKQALRLGTSEASHRDIRRLSEACDQADFEVQMARDKFYREMRIASRLYPKLSHQVFYYMEPPVKSTTAKRWFQKTAPLSP